MKVTITPNNEKALHFNHCNIIHLSYTTMIVEISSIRFEFKLIPNTEVLIEEEEKESPAGDPLHINDSYERKI